MRSRETLEVILDAAARVLAREGYDRASTNRIAEVAGVSIGSVYQFFPNKEAIFTALRRRYFDELDALFAAEAPKLLELGPRDSLRFGLELVLQVRRQNRGVQRALDWELPFVLSNDPSLDRVCYQLALQKLEQLPAGARPPNLEMAARISVAVLDAITRLASVQHPEYLDSEEFIDEVTELLWRFVDRYDERKQPVDPPAKRRSSRERNGGRLVAHRT